MIDHARLRVSLAEGDYGVPVCREITIDGPMLSAFEPVDVCDDALVAFTVGGITRDMLHIVKKKREGYAKYLGEKIAAEILAFMESKDKTNGYRREQLPQVDER